MFVEESPQVLSEVSRFQPKICPFCGTACGLADRERERCFAHMYIFIYLHSIRDGWVMASSLYSHFQPHPSCSLEYKNLLVNGKHVYKCVQCTCCVVTCLTNCFVLCDLARAALVAQLVEHLLSRK